MIAMFISSVRLCTRIYLILIALTLFTWWVGESEPSGHLMSALVLLVALQKGMLIGDYFMQLKLVSGAWRYVVMLWLLLIISLIDFAFYISV